MNEEDENAEETFYVDERDLIKLKTGIIGYGLVGILFIIAPIILALFTYRDISVITTVICIIFAIKCCWDQVWGRVEILSQLTIVTDEDVEDNFKNR